MIDRMGGPMGLGGAARIHGTYSERRDRGMSMHRYLPCLLLAVVLAAAPVAAQDTTAPTVTGTTPEQDAVGVALDLQVAFVHFDGQMDRSSYADNIFITIGTDPGGPRVAVGTILTGGTYCGLPLAEDLTAETLYGLHVATGVADLAGNHLAADFTATFTTVLLAHGDEDPPFIVATEPLAGAVGVATDLAAVSFSFNEPVDAASLPSAVALRVGLTADGPVVAVAAPSVAESTCVLDLVGPLEPGTVYSLHAGTGVADPAGNHLAAPFAASFRTAAAAQDQSPPFVTSTDPADGAGGIRQDIASVRVDFNEIMDIDTYEGNIIVTGPGAGVAGLVVGVSHVTVLLSGALAISTEYAVEVGAGVTDLAGNALDAPHTVSFTTSDQVPDDRTTWGGLKARYR